MRVFDIENVMHCNEHKGKRKEDEGQILRSCSQTQFYFLSKKLLLFSYITLSSRWARGVGLTKRLREKGYCKKDILDVTGKRIKGELLTKGTQEDSRGLI